MKLKFRLTVAYIWVVIVFKNSNFKKLVHLSPWTSLKLVGLTLCEHVNTCYRLT